MKVLLCVLDGVTVVITHNFFDFAGDGDFGSFKKTRKAHKLWD